MTPSETDDLLATLAAIAHRVLDEHRDVRQGLRDFPESNDSALLRAALHDCIQLVERIVTAILGIGDAPEGSSALLTTLVAAIPVAIRLASLCEELSNEDEGFARRAVEELMSRLRACLDRHPTHGRGCAIIALLTAYCRQVDVMRKAEKLAIHYGAAAFLERELERIEVDLDLTEDAG